MHLLQIFEIYVFSKMREWFLYLASTSHTLADMKIVQCGCMADLHSRLQFASIRDVGINRCVCVNRQNSVERQTRAKFIGCLRSKGNMVMKSKSGGVSILFYFCSQEDPASPFSLSLSPSLPTSSQLPSLLPESFWDHRKVYTLQVYWFHKKVEIVQVTSCILSVKA